MYNEHGPTHKLADKLQSELTTILPAKICYYSTKKKSDDNQNKAFINGPKTDLKSFHISNFTTDEGEGHNHQQQPNSAGAGGGQSFKDIVISNDKKEEASSLTSYPQPSESNVQYNRILVPHDGSEGSDSALNHAIYLSKMSDAEIIILHVLEHMDNMNSSAVTATSKGQSGAKQAGNSNRDEEFDITIEGEVKHMIEEKMRFCKEAGVKSQISYKIQTGKPVEEIVKSAEDMNVDLIVMASSKSSSLAKRILGSTSRKVLDGLKKPVLIVHI
jgi:nucleotide-binding universal stress UspA family protein